MFQIKLLLKRDSLQTNGYFAIYSK